MTARRRVSAALRGLPWPDRARRLVRHGRTVAARRAAGRLEARLAGPRVLRAFAKAYPDAFFIEIGANDGEQHDHLRPILAAYPWRGIMVEPVPYVFERLSANLRDTTRVTLANVAVADRNGSLPFYHLRHAADRDAEGLPQWYDGIGSFNKQAVLGHADLLPGLEERLECSEIRCVTFDALCEEHSVDRVDLLVVDTEGYDGTILRSIDWTVHHPRLLVFEHYHLEEDERRHLGRMLSGLGYRLMHEGFDTWCVSSDVAASVASMFHRSIPGLPAASVRDDR